MKDSEKELKVLRERIRQLEEQNNSLREKAFAGIITEREHAERTLSQHDELYTLITNIVLVGIVIVDGKGNFEFVNPAFIDMIGYTRDELMKLNLSDIIDKENFMDFIEQSTIRDQGMYSRYENTLFCKDGSLLTVLVSASPLVEGYTGSTKMLAVFTDISLSKKAEEELLESEEWYKDLVENAGIAILIDDKEGNFKFFNKKFSQLFGYTPEEMKKQSIKSLVHPDDFERVIQFHKKRLEGENVPVRYEFRGVKRNGETLFLEVDAVKLFGKGNEIIGTRSYLWDVSDRKGAEEELRGIQTELEQLIEERTVWLSTTNDLLKQQIRERKNAEEELKKSFISLRRTLAETAQAIANVVEARDPYTAGHQQRVTELACAIAKEMDLLQDQIEGIRISGLLHDIGKVNIPAEILNKPGSLDDLEYKLIRNHPRVGYDILKNINFPWSVALIVLQHHERIDGSGYPSGLSGEDILLEARILAVADVIEAMSSHRPYRPALGLDAALKEILNKRGILFDPDVVDAGLRVFAERNFEFKRRKEN
jgi:PAS domain S-box-containing protein/putative nucleotidyltransferase with HDIG domain